MPFDPLPPAASWRHHGLREGFETLHVTRGGAGTVLRGHTTAWQDGAGWTVGYRIELDVDGSTRDALVHAVHADGEVTRHLERVDAGWLVDGEPRPDLAGLVDVDLESSAVTNALPVRRLDPSPGAEVSAPAVFVTVPDLEVRVIEQAYLALEPGRYDYSSDTFAFATEITFDTSGLAQTYPGIATRHR